jgi:flagellar protein FliO/FliZ
MEQLRDFIPPEYLIVAFVVLVVLFVITLAFRALAGRSSGAESSRLGISEYLDVDKQRRLVLVRRDNVEHLVLIGGSQDLVVEAAIHPGVQRREEVPAAPRVIAGDRLDEREPTPAVSRPRGTTRPVPLRPGRPAGFGDQPLAPAQDPAERPEPRLEALQAKEKSHEA